MSLRSDSPCTKKGYATKGKTPVMEHTAKRFKINMIQTLEFYEHLKVNGKHTTQAQIAFTQL